MGAENVTLRFAVKYDGGAINEARFDFQKLVDFTKASTEEVEAFKKDLILARWLRQDTSCLIL